MRKCAIGWCIALTVDQETPPRRDRVRRSPETCCAVHLQHKLPHPPQPFTRSYLRTIERRAHWYRPYLTRWPWDGVRSATRPPA